MSILPIRPATPADAAIVTAHRRSMFSEMGYADEGALDAMCEAFRPWVVQKMEAGEYLGWLVCEPDGEVVAGAGLWLMDWPPHLIGGSARRGNILNVYTRPDHRRHGMARSLIEAALAWCRTHGVQAVILHASDEGRELYLKMGFVPSNEMRLVLESQRG